MTTTETLTVQIAEFTVEADGAQSGPFYSAIQYLTARGNDGYPKYAGQGCSLEEAFANAIRATKVDAERSAKRREVEARDADLYEAEQARFQATRTQGASPVHAAEAAAAHHGLAAGSQVWDNA